MFKLVCKIDTCVILYVMSTTTEKSIYWRERNTSLIFIILWFIIVCVDGSHKYMYVTNKQWVAHATFINHETIKMKFIFLIYLIYTLCDLVRKPNCYMLVKTWYWSKKLIVLRVNIKPVFDENLWPDLDKSGEITQQLCSVIAGFESGVIDYTNVAA